MNLHLQTSKQNSIISAFASKPIQGKVEYTSSDEDIEKALDYKKGIDEMNKRRDPDNVEKSDYLSTDFDYGTPNKTIYGDVIVCDQRGQVLFLKRTSTDDFGAGKWALPGGKVEIGERCDLGAARELFEEAGIECKEELRELIKMTNDDGSESHYYYYAVHNDDVNIVLDEEEHDQYQWMSQREWEECDCLLNLVDRMRTIYPIAKMYGAYVALKA